MIRLQENVPEIYTKASRDFQLFCRVYDVINNSTRFSVKSTRTLLDPMLTSDRMLPLLATRVGFFPKYEYNTNALRLVISVFPYMMRWKGSKKSIEIALYTVLKAEGHFGELDVTINSSTSTIRIFSDTKIDNEILLKDVLSYVLPIGYDVIIQYSKTDRSSTTQMVAEDTLDTSILYDTTISRVLSASEISSINSDDSTSLVYKDSIGNQSVSVVPNKKGEE